MRSKILIVLFSLFSICCNKKGKSQSSIVSVAKEQIENDSTPEEIIIDFYQQYIKLQDTPPSAENRTRIDAVLKKYLTKALISRIRKASLDYDPLINAQDVSIGWLKTLKVHKKNLPQSEYSICYVSTYDSTTKCIDLKVDKVDGVYKISDVLDDNLSPIVGRKSSVSLDNITYSYHIESKGDLRTAISYYIEIHSDSEILFKRESYSNAFNYKCSKSKLDNAIQLFHEKTIEGKDPNLGTPLITILDKEGKYYAVSPLIKKGNEVELTQEQ